MAQEDLMMFTVMALTSGAVLFFGMLILKRYGLPKDKKTLEKKH